MTDTQAPWLSFAQRPEMLGKLIGGIAGLVCGGPFGAVVGAAIGHAADSGSFAGLTKGISAFGGGPGAASAPLQQARLAALLGRRDQAFAVHVVVLSAKLAKIDGAIGRAEIDAFKQVFHFPPDSVHEVGRLFDQARADPGSFEPHAAQLAMLFADAKPRLEGVLGGLFHIARADGPLVRAELDFLTRVHAAFGLDQQAWQHARGGGGEVQGDPYAVLGLTAAADDDLLRQTRKRLMRENHPDTLASRNLPATAMATASDRVARINAAWDQIKRDRRL